MQEKPRWTGLTEAEAKTKICPMCMDGTQRSCKASKCMAWRWAGHDNDFQYRGLSAILQPLPTGFCGLAEPRTFTLQHKDEEEK